MRDSDYDLNFKFWGEHPIVLRLEIGFYLPRRKDGQFRSGGLLGGRPPVLFIFRELERRKFDGLHPLPTKDLLARCSGHI